MQAKNDKFKGRDVCLTLAVPSRQHHDNTICTYILAVDVAGGVDVYQHCLVRIIKATGIRSAFPRYQTLLGHPAQLDITAENKICKLRF